MGSRFPQGVVIGLVAGNNAPTSSSEQRPSKALIPLADGAVLEDDYCWASGSKTIEQRTLELLEEGYELVTTRVDGTRLFERRASATGRLWEG